MKGNRDEPNHFGFRVLPRPMWQDVFSSIGQGLPCFATRAITTCARATEWWHALHVLEGFDIRALQRNLVICNAAISACEKGRQWLKACELFEVLKLPLPVSPDIISFNTCISACENWHLALKLLGDVGRQNVKMQTITCNAAMSGQWCQTLNLFKYLSKQQLRSSVVSYGAVTRSYDPDGHWQAALHCMKCCCNHGLKTSVVLYGSSISSCETASQWQSALMLFCTLRTLKLEANAVVATAAMSSCERGGKWHQSLALLPMMHRIGIQPNVVGINIALRSTAWPIALRTQTDQAALTVVSLGSLAHAMDREGDWIMACHFLMEAFCHQQQSNAVVVGSLMSSCEGNEEWQQAISLLAGHRRQELEPNLVIRSACASAGVSASAWQCGLQALHGDATDGVANGAMVSAWKTGWCWSRAVAALAALPESFPPAAGAAAAACASSASWAFALEVAKGLQDAVASEVLSDACTHARQGQHLAQVLEETSDDSLAALQFATVERTVKGTTFLSRISGPYTFPVKRVPSGGLGRYERLMGQAF